MLFRSRDSSAIFNTLMASSSDLYVVPAAFAGAVKDRMISVASSVFFIFPLVYDLMVRFYNTFL